MAAESEQTMQDLSDTEHFSTLYGLTLIFLSCAVFKVCLYLVKQCGLPHTVQRSQYWKWTNLCVSLIHASIVAVWDILCLISYPEFAEDLYRYQNMWMYSMGAVSVGYFVYEFLDICINGHLISYWEVTLHHVAAIWCFGFHVVSNQGTGYTTMALMAEVNSVFLHLRKLLQMKQVGFNHWMYRLVVLLNLSTYLVFRFIPIFYCLRDMTRSWHMFSRVYYWTIVPAASILVPVNIGLFLKLAKSDIIKPMRGKKSS